MVRVPYGRALMGRCGAVPGLVLVATEFYYLWVFPLFPKRSWFVVAEGAGGWRGVPYRPPHLWDARSVSLVYGKLANGLLTVAFASAIVNGTGSSLTVFGLGVGTAVAAVGFTYLW